MIGCGAYAAQPAGTEQWLEQVRCFDGQRLPAEIHSELKREHERLAMVEQQIRGIEKRQRDEVAAMDSEQMRKVTMLKIVAACHLAKRSPGSAAV